jgi:hypothetical protein
MKTLIAVLMAGVVVGLTTFGFVSKQDAAKLNQAQAAWDAEKAQLQAEAQKQPERVVVEKSVTNITSVVVEESAQEILNDLLALKPGIGSERNPALRKVVYKLELLASRGAAALPAIHNFSSQNIDVSYEVLTNDVVAATNSAADNNRRGFGGPRGSGRGEARRARDLTNFGSTWVAPPTLRLGVIGVLKEIGSAGAEQELAYMLGTTGRGVEVAYLAVTLEQISPGKYRDAAVAAAKELLLTPPTAENVDRLDALAKSYLYGVLEFYKDTSFAVNAQQMLVGANGRLNLDALDYLSQTFKEQSVSALYAAYQNPSLTNQSDKFDLGREMMGYVGQNSQANQFFTETLQNQNLDPRAKTFAIARLAGGGFGPFAADTPQDPQVVNSRIQLLSSLQPQFAADEQLSQVISATITSLQTGQPLDMRQVFGGGRRGGGGGGGN